MQIGRAVTPPDRAPLAEFDKHLRGHRLGISQSDVIIPGGSHTPLGVAKTGNQHRALVRAQSRIGTPAKLAANDIIAPVRGRHPYAEGCRTRGLEWSQSERPSE